MSEVELVSEYPVPARRLYDLLCTPAFQEALAFRLGAQEVTATENARHGEVSHMTIELLDPTLDRSGNLAEGRGERIIINHDWNRESLSSHWTRHAMDRGKSFLMEGDLRVESIGEEACRLVERCLVVIKVPVFGRSQEKRIIDRLRETLAQRADFIMKRLGLSE